MSGKVSYSMNKTLFYVGRYPYTIPLDKVSIITDLSLTDYQIYSNL